MLVESVISITIRADRSVTCYEHGGGRSCISVGGDQGWFCCWSFQVRSWSLRNGEVLEWRRSWGGEDFGMEKVSERLRSWNSGMRLWVGDISWMDFGSCGCLGGNFSVVWTRVIILVWVKFWLIVIKVREATMTVAHHALLEVYGVAKWAQCITIFL